MTAQSFSAQAAEAALVPAVEQVTLTIDGFEITVPKGTLVIRAAEELGIAVPRFCDHPLLDPVAACPVPGGRRGAAQAAAILRDHLHRRHGRAHSAHLGGG